MSGHLMSDEPWTVDVASLSDRDWLTYKLGRALDLSANMLPDPYTQDGLQLAGTVMRLDSVCRILDEAAEAIHSLYRACDDREQELAASRTVGGTSEHGAGVVADILRAATAGVRPA
jgi:hypothetical protein